MSAKLEALLRTAAAGKRQAAKVRSAGNSRAQTREPGLFTRMAALYTRMEEAYKACAGEAGLSCRACPTNCCTSYFQHHTHVEWAYLWRGLHALPEQRRSTLLERARDYVEQARRSLAMNRPPTAMCPLNEDGLCVLYAHRMMICRMHGTRNVFTRPDGRQQVFPGCARFTALPCSQQPGSPDSPCPTLDRTPFYLELAGLEREFLHRARQPLPRVDLTLAEMMVMGPPRLV